MPRSNKSGSKRDPLVADLMDTFEWAYEKAFPYLELFDELQRIYDNTISDGKWPTKTRMPIPLMFNMVEKALPNAVDYLMAQSGFLMLIPKEPDVPIDMIYRAENAIEHTIKYEMRLQHYSYPTLKDCFKLGLGFGIVQAVSRSLPISAEEQMIDVKTGKVLNTTRSMRLGAPVQCVEYKYISPGQIIVTPDGSDFNGPHAVSIAYFVDSYSEAQIRDMYAKQPRDGENMPLKGTAKQIIEQARQMGFQSRTSIVDTIAALGGLELNQSGVSDKNIPVRVPVIKCYQRHRHTWIANGETIIFDAQDDYQTMRCNLVKASAWPDGERFYPTNPAMAGRKLTVGYNIFVDSIYDLVSRYWRPPVVYDKQKFPGGLPPHGPDDSIGSVGTTKDAVTYLENPPMPQQVFTVGELIAQMWGEVVNQPEYLNQAKPGLVRGGSFALGDLTKTTTMRDVLAATILETGWLESVVRQTMLTMQNLTGATGKTFYERKYDPNTEKEYIDRMTVTEDDLNRAYDMVFTLKQKHRQSLVNIQRRDAEYDRLSKNPFADQYQVATDYIGDRERAKRILFSPERVRRMQEENRAAELRAQEQAAATQTGGPGATPGEGVPAVGEEAVEGAMAGMTA